MDTRYTAEVTKNSPIYGVDFGTGDALAIHGPDGAVSKRALKLPKVKGGRTPAMEFVMVAEALMAGSDDVPAGDIVVESPTIGSSGCEPKDVADLLARVPGRSMFTISARAVKNYRADHPDLGWKKGARYVRDGDPAPAEMTIHEQAAVHVEDAEIIYKIATETPARLYRWLGPSAALDRDHTSVRPMDKHGYRNDRALGLLSLLPKFETLPAELRDVLGDEKKGYSGSVAMPFAMASTEPFIDEGPREDRRRRYEKVIGLYDRGYPSFYRRATIVWMQSVAKALAGVTRNAEVSPEIRKQAWKITQRQIRQFFHLTMAHQGR